MRIHLFIFFRPIYYLRPSILSPPIKIVVTQIRGHIAGSSPLSTAVRALHFFSRQDFSSFFPRQLASNCAYQRSALSAVDFFSFFLANKFKSSPRRDSNSRTNASSIRGLPLLIVHRSDRLLTTGKYSSNCSKTTSTTTTTN